MRSRRRAPPRPTRMAASGGHWRLGRWTWRRRCGAARRLLDQAAQTADPVRRLEAAKDLTGKKSSAIERDHVAVCLRALASLLRDIGILANHGEARSLANADLLADLERLTASFDSERSMRAFTAVDRALAALERNASPKVVADWLVLQL